MEEITLAGRSSHLKGPHEKIGAFTPDALMRADWVYGANGPLKLTLIPAMSEFAESVFSPQAV